MIEKRINIQTPANKSSAVDLMSNCFEMHGINGSVQKGNGQPACRKFSSRSIVEPRLNLGEFPDQSFIITVDQLSILKVSRSKMIHRKRRKHVHNIIKEGC